MFESGDLIKSIGDDVAYLVLDHFWELQYTVLVVKSVPAWYAAGDTVIVSLPQDRWQKVEGTV